MKLALACVVTLAGFYGLAWLLSEIPNFGLEG